MNNLSIKTVDFFGDSLVAAKDESTKKIYTGVSYICKGIGLSKDQKDRQVKNIQSDLVLNKGCVKFDAGVIDPNNEVLGIELDFLPLWLAKISITPKMQEEQPEVTEKLVKYQLEAKDVLAKAFIKPMSKELQAIFVIDEKTVELDNRVTVIEERMTIETGKQKALCDLVNGKVIAILGGKDTPAYRELGKKAFRQCWNDYKKALNVASYKDTPIKDFELGKKTIIDWKPNRELELMIKGCNSYR
jgi:hypothetical protein